MNMNQAIYQVLTSKFKKDAPEAFAMVKAAGYEVEKWNSQFHVINPETRRSIRIDEHRVGRGCNVVTGPYMKNRHTFKSLADTWKVDFEGALKKPVSHDYYRQVEKEANYLSKAREKYDRLQTAIRYAKWDKDREECLIKEIADKQKELQRLIENRVKAEAEINKVRKAVGLR